MGGESAGFAGFGQYHHRQAPNHQPAGRAVHRLSPRGGKINIGAGDATESKYWPVIKRCRLL